MTDLERLKKNPDFQKLPKKEQYECLFAINADGPVPILEDEKIVKEDKGSMNDTSMATAQSFLDNEQLQRLSKESTEIKTFVLGLNGKGGLQEDVKDMKEILTGMKSSLDELSSRFIKEISDTHGRIDRVDDRLSKLEEANHCLKKEIEVIKNGEVDDLKDKVIGNKNFWKNIVQNLTEKVITYGTVALVCALIIYVLGKLNQPIPPIPTL